MALPLPKVIPDTMAGGGVVTAMRGGNALSQDMLGTQIKQAEADYAPWTQYANAASKIAYSNMLPYQMQATVMSNPMIWMVLKDNPKALNALMQNLTQSMPTPEQMRGGTNMPPQPGQAGGRGHGLLNSLLGLMGIGGQGGQPQPQNPLAGMPQPQMQPSPQPQGQQGAGPDRGYSYDANGNNIKATDQEIDQAGLSGELPQQGEQPAQSKGTQLSPASESPISGVIGSETAKFSQQPYTPGLVATINGQNVSVPSGTQVQDLQNAYIGIKNAVPLMKRLAAGAPEFLEKGQKGKLLFTKLNNLVEQYGNIQLIPDDIKKDMGVDDAKLSRYAQWRAELEKAPEVLMNSFKLPQNELTTKKLGSIVEPLPGEKSAGYAKRILEETLQLTNERLPLYESILKSGIPLDKGKPNIELKPDMMIEAPKPQQQQQAPSIKLQPDEWIIYSPQGEKVGIATTAQSNALFKDHKGYYRKKT